MSLCKSPTFQSPASAPSKLVGAELVDIDEDSRSFTDICCDDISGMLYLEKLQKQTGGKDLEKYILFKGTMITPQEFKILGENKAWKVSKYKSTSF